jgi:glycosyltransferase involved in cell wall biosynthesis
VLSSVGGVYIVNVREVITRLRTFRRQWRQRRALMSTALFQEDWYVTANPDASIDPIGHYLAHGSDGRRPSPWFDASWYLAQNADIAATGQNPLSHYVLFGAAEGRDPNPFFSGPWYLQNYPKAKGALTPIDHYIHIGAAARNFPSPKFDTRWYVDNNPDAASSGLEPLAHFLLVGQAERRSPLPSNGSAVGESVSHARMEIVKPVRSVKGRTVALFVAHLSDGRLKPNVGFYLRALVDADVGVVLIAATDRPFAIDPNLKTRLAGIYVRENRGFDFAAWAHLMHAEPGVFAADMLLLLNDSLIGPFSQFAFEALLERIRTLSADVVGAIDSCEHGWHLQSFFLALKRPALSSFALQAFFHQVRTLDDRDQVIRAYEVTFAPRMQAAGLVCKALFPSGDGTNPAVFHWRRLINAGFPFVKTLTLRGELDAQGVDIGGWRKVLKREGADLQVAEMTLDAAEVRHTRPASEWPLLQDPLNHAAFERPFKVAFVGPWNYANGLGGASRGYVSALMRAGLRLNLYPIERPFHIHAQTAPPIPICDFDGPADVVIIHMNPDGWHLLTDQQRHMIGAARRRVGLWVWEMDHLPTAWEANFGKVDAIWAPSRYCAEVFASYSDAPTAVVPHVVEVPAAREGGEKAAMLKQLGLPVDARVILYTFDGSSYLVRKNPHVLVQAFAQSGLAARGWRLVLKTKHLMDRPEDGKAFAALAASSTGVVLIDEPMAHEELACLFATADIYASPHRSEGFGLTVAEAMAAGKLVVASDYGGSRDFLDATCGFPVPVKVVTLDQDFGHYTKGGVWSEVDRNAFMRALVDAADQIEAGNLALGGRARARIHAQLSADAVATEITVALDRLIKLDDDAERRSLAYQ